MSDWGDVWSEYRRFFVMLGLRDEDRARGVVSGLGGMDRVADALKEFAVRCQERGVPDVRVLDELEHAAVKLTGDGPGVMRSTRAAQLFGTAAEDLGGDRILLLAQRVMAVNGR